MSLLLRMRSRDFVGAVALSESATDPLLSEIADYVVNQPVRNEGAFSTAALSLATVLAAPCWLSGSLNAESGWVLLFRALFWRRDAACRGPASSWILSKAHSI